MAFATTQHIRACGVFHPLALACALACAASPLLVHAAEVGDAGAAASNSALNSSQTAGKADKASNAAPVLVAQQTTGQSVQIAAAQADRNSPVLRDVVISASRDEQSADSLPMSIDVIDAKNMEEEQISDIRELADKLPNVEVPRSPARFGLAGAGTGRAGEAAALAGSGAAAGPQGASAAGQPDRGHRTRA